MSASFPDPATIPSPGPSRVVFSGVGVVVSREDRGVDALFRISGAFTDGLGAWLAHGLRDVRGSAGIVADPQFAADPGLARALLQLLARKVPVVLIAPPAGMRELLDPAGAGPLPALSSEGAFLAGRSLADSAAEERVALSVIAPRFRVNPLWRRVDREEKWICALCGVGVEDARLPDPARPGTTALLAVRRHLLEACASYRAGREVALPASLLDAFLIEVNKGKGLADPARDARTSGRVESLQERFESMVETEQSVQEAKRRQLHLLPVDPPHDSVAEIAVVYRPFQKVSGDFLDFCSLPGNRFGVAIGDVSGHGVEAAVVMGLAKMSLRVRSETAPNVREVMTQVNRDLTRDLHRTAFVTAFLGMIDRGTRRMVYGRAGHPPALWRRNTGECAELDAGGLPFGVDEGPRFAAGLDPREASLARDDVLLLYTDGVTEAEAREQFGVERLRAALRAAPAEGSASEILGSVVAALDGFLGGAPPGDDVTLICLKIR